MKRNVRLYSISVIGGIFAICFYIQYGIFYWRKMKFSHFSPIEYAVIRIFFSTFAA